MSKSFWLVFLAGIFGITSWLANQGESHPFGGDFVAPVPPTLGGKLPVTSNFSPRGGETDNAKRSSEGLLQPIVANTNSTLSVKLQDLPVGKTIRIGNTTDGLSFVKVGESQYLSVTAACVDPVLTTTGAQKLFSYSGNYQSYTFYAGCEYQIELWGAQGGSGTGCNGWSRSAGYGAVNENRSYGAYTSGQLQIPAGMATLYIYVGQQGTNASVGKDSAAAYNGGGSGTWDHGDDESSGGGGGATDMRTISGDWNNANSLRSRVIVAAGSGGQSCVYYPGSGGGVNGYQSYKGNSSIEYQTRGDSATSVTLATQISGNAFGIGGNASGTGCSDGVAGGGSGWYGSGAGQSTNCESSGGGGSSYISGHTGCVAVASTSSSSPKSGCTTGTTNNSCSISPYGYTFTNTIMIDGDGYQWTNVKGALKAMPNPTGGNYASGVGHTGNGYARITRLN